MSGHSVQAGAEKKEKQFGLWPSDLSPEILGSTRRITSFCFGDNERLYWLESRADKATICYTDWSSKDAVRELNANLNCKGKIGYGGGDFSAAQGSVFFSERSSGRIYKQMPGEISATPLTLAHGTAAGSVASADGRFVAYVHAGEHDIDRIAIVGTDGQQWPQILEQGADFYSQLRFSPDGQHFAFVSWCHPHMPWDSSALFVGRLEQSNGMLPVLTNITMIAGGPEIAVFQPEFSPDSKSIYYVSDESGFGHLYRQDLQSGEKKAITSGTTFELGMPNWVQDVRSFCLADGGRTIFVGVNKGGIIQVHAIDIETRKMTPVPELAEYTDLTRIYSSPDGKKILLGVSSWNQPSALVGFDFGTREKRVFGRVIDYALNANDLSKPSVVTWRTEKLEECHGLIYMPNNSRFTSTKEKPPLVVHIHGGPTSQTVANFNAGIQFFTNRGYAVLAVNHRGSTGYGRAYMEKLRGKWGVVDVADAVYGARHFADAGLIDGSKVVIMGGSAGGYTVLQALVNEPEVFAAGISLYGISNLFTLAKDTHKFEAFYNDSLIGPLPAAAKLYRERSPEFHASEIKKPLAIFQGDKDLVVPKNQAEAIVKALSKGGTPHIYHLYEGEGHGFTKPETIKHMYATIDEFLQEHVIAAR